MLARLLLCILLAIGFKLPRGGEISAGARAQMAAILKEKSRRSVWQRKMDSRLLGAGGNVAVDIRGTVTPGLLAAVGAAGEVLQAIPGRRFVRARLPGAALESIARRAEVRQIRAADFGVTLAGPDTTGDIAHQANLVRSQLGFTGAGVKIGVISDGVTSLASEQAAGRLPANVTVLPGQANATGADEGTAMLEVIYTLAPGAQLYFATSGGSPEQMAANIQALVAAGCNIVVDDVMFPAEGVFQADLLSQTITSAAAQGVFYFSAAGNLGRLDAGSSGTWEGDFNPGGAAIAAIGAIEAGSVHSFGSANSNLLTKDAAGISLKWSDPLGAASNDYDLFVLDSTLSTVLASSTTTQDGVQDPYESVGPQPAGSRVVIVNYGGAAAVRALHLDTQGGGLAIATGGAVYGHNAAADGFSIGAVNVATASGGAFTGVGNAWEAFSADGPRRMFLTPGGTPLSGGVTFASGGGVVLSKPDYAGGDGVPTGAPGYPTFSGTSAGAAHAAAIAALVKQAKPSITIPQMRAALTASALGPQAIAMALGAVQAATAVTVTIASSIPGLSFTVTGSGCSAGSYATPQALAWAPGSSCTVNIADPAPSGGVKNSFSGWADGPVMMPRTFTAPAANTTYTANFLAVSYLLTVQGGAGGVVAPATGYVAAGTAPALSATPNPGYTFGGWTGSGTGSYTGTNPTPQITVNAPITETAAFQPLTSIRYNAGGTVYNDPVGNVWFPDPAVANTFTFLTQNPVKNTGMPYLYQSERFSLGAAWGYTFPLPNGTYNARLLFAETYFTQRGQRIFHVDLNGTRALQNFDILAAAGGSNTAVDTLHSVTVTNGQLAVQFTPVVSNPKISAIEILPAAAAIVVGPGVSPALSPGQTQAFTATVAGSANTAVTWSVSAGPGSVSPAGVYTAPASIANPQKATVTATSQADPGRKASATVSLIPQPFTSQDIGSPNVPGSFGAAANAYTMSGGGDVNGFGDSFRLAATTLTGDGAIVARVNQPFTGANANKSGVMLRDAAVAGAAHAFTSLFAAIVGLFEWRSGAGAATGVQFGAAGVPWVRLNRIGNVFSSYVSNDAVNWIAIGGPQTLIVGNTLEAGLAVSNGFAAAANQVTFDNVDVSTSPVAVAVNEGIASLGAGQQTQFTANVTGTANTAVTWSLAPAGQGTIDPQSGVYTAPGAIANPSLQTVTITATSVADGTKTASVVVFLGGFVPVHVNCGGPTHYDPTGQLWYGDTNAAGGMGNVFSSGAAITGTATPYIYQSERFMGGAPLTYRFPVPNGSRTVTLKFAEIFFTAANQRVMNVVINGVPVESGLDIVATAGARTALDRTYPVNVSNGLITITLSPAVAGHSPKVNAIVIQ